MKALKVDSYYLYCKQVTGAQKMQKGEKCKETGKRKRTREEKSFCVRMGE